MAKQADVKEIEQDGEIRSKRKFDAADWNHIAEYVIDEYARRKSKRRDRERQWKEIDRQIAMEPDTAFKYIIKNGTRTLDMSKAWMSEMELPLQAQALEVLGSDTRRLMFPSSGSPFHAHGAMTDEYLARVDFQSLIAGDESEVPSQINQDNCDKLIEGFLLHNFAQYDLPTRVDRINAEAFKYGMGIARGRKETKTVYIHEAKGTISDEQIIPVLAPCSIKNLYLDDPLPSMHSAQVLGPSHIAEDWIRLENLILAANKGSTDPDNEDGGWMPTNVKKLEATKEGFVQILEMEGDIVVPRKTVRSVIIPGAIVTVAVGGAKAQGGEDSCAVVRFRFRKMPFSSYLLFPYNFEGCDDAYPSGPLMKGLPVQMMATHALNRLMDSAMLKNHPPIGYDRNDSVFALSGGPEIFPGAQWGTSDPIKVHAEVGGDPVALAGILQQALHFYAELTGVLPARLGAQTVSHTTAYAKGAELQRGAVRTVDYVDQCAKGPLTRWLDMSYRMARGAMGSKEMTFFIDAYGGFVTIDKQKLPDEAVFEWIGAGGPDDDNAKTMARLRALDLAMKMDQIGRAYGEPATVKIAAAIREVLREGRWTDLDAITSAGAAAGTAPAPGIPIDAGLGAGPPVAAIQTLSAGPRG